MTEKVSEEYLKKKINTSLLLKTGKARIPSEATIRVTMQATGWDAYKSYCKLVEIAYKNGVTYQEILNKRLWRDFKYQEAQILIGIKENDAYIYEVLSERLLTKEEFYKYFYSDEQRQSMQQIRQGNLTYENLFKFLKLTPPDIGIENTCDMHDKIAYLLANVKKGGIFFCIRRANLSIDKIRRKKPACVITIPDYYNELEELEIPHISCRFLRSYLFEISEMWKSSKSAKTIAITGSIGKTTTAEMIAKVAKASFKTLRLPGNQNTRDQIIETVFRIKKETEVYVQECSGSYLGQLEAGSTVLKPDFFVVTNIGQGHIGNYDGKQEFLMYEKVALDRNAAPNAIGIINWDDPLLKKAHYDHQIIRCAINDKSADVIADNIIEKNGGIDFNIVENSNGKRSTPVRLNVSGIHNVYNALCAFSIGVQMNMDRETITKALASYKPQGVRQNLTQLAGQNIYIDCYSATVESMETAMRVIPSIEVSEGKRKIAVLADIPDLGKDSEEKHRDIGKMIAEINSADEIFLYGHEMKYAMEEAAARGICCRLTDNRLTLEKWMQEAFENTGLFVMKASHRMAFQWVLDDLFGTAYYCYDELCNKVPILSFAEMEYKCIDEYGSVLISVNKTMEDIDLPETVNGLHIRVIGREVFKNSRLCKISLPKKLRTIAEGAFESCKVLDGIVLPETLQFIGEAAFRNCSRMKEIVIPENCTTISDFAFSACSGLQKVYLPSALKTIGDNAFDEGLKTEFICPPDSYAEQWAREKGYNVISLSNELTAEGMK